MDIKANLSSRSQLLGNQAPFILGMDSPTSPPENTKKVLTFAIFGDIGKWYGDTGKNDILDMLQNTGSLDEIHAIISSPGGNIDDALVMVDLIASHPAKTTAWLTGQVASAATFLACAFDEVVVSKQCTYMIHRGSTGIRGNASDLRKMADVLEKHDNRIVDIYSRRTGLQSDLIMELMEEETWFEGNELVELGFADRLVDNISIGFDETVQLAGQDDDDDGWGWWHKGQEVANSSRIQMRQRGFRPYSNTAVKRLMAPTPNSKSNMRKLFTSLLLFATAQGLSIQNGKFRKGDKDLSEDEILNLPGADKLLEDSGLGLDDEGVKSVLAKELPSIQQTVSVLVLDQLQNEAATKAKFVESLKAEFQKGLVSQVELKAQVDALTNEIAQVKLGHKAAGASNGNPALGTTVEPKVEKNGNEFGNTSDYLGTMLKNKVISQAVYDRLVAESTAA